MSFQPNHPKVGGRKSTELPKDIRHIKRSVREFLDATNVNPIAELIKLARRKSTPVEIRVRAWAEITKYAFPRLSTIAVSGQFQVDHRIEMLKIERLMRDPELAVAAERLALGLAALPQPTPAQLSEAMPEPTREQIIDATPESELIPLPEPTLNDGSPFLQDD